MNLSLNTKRGSVFLPSFQRLFPSALVVLGVVGFNALLPSSSWALGKAERKADSTPQVVTEKSSNASSQWGTHLDEIVRWQDLSDQYVLGFGIDPKTGHQVPFAVYDKTMTNASYPLFWRYLILGTIGISDLNLGYVYQAIERSRIAAEANENETSPNQSKMVLAGDFWKSKMIYWKLGKEPNRKGPPPEVISFKDFDWVRMNRQTPQLKKIFSDLQASADEGTLSELGLHKAQLVDIQFKLQPDGKYHSMQTNSEVGIRPMKIIDFRHKEGSLKYATLWAVGVNGIKGGINAIPFLYGPPQATVAILDRVFDFVELLYLHHHAQALHLVSEALDGNQNSPFANSLFTEEDLNDALFYLLRSQTMLSAVIKNSFSKNETLVLNYNKLINERREREINSLRERGIEVYPIPNTYFAVGFQKDPENHELKKLKVYALAYPKLGRSKKPHAVVDFVHQGRELHKREILQTILMATNFIPNIVPGAASIAKLFFKEVVVREYHRREMWENGYLAHLHYSPDELRNILISHVGLTEAQAGELETSATHLIENRRLNPVDLTSDQIPLLREQVEKWISSHDPSYAPLF